MNVKLPDELIRALDANGDELELVDPRNNRVYVLVDRQSLLHARAALELQQQQDISAIRLGIEDLQAGRTIPIDEAHQQIREHLVARYGK